MARAAGQRKSNPRADAAFADYVAMGPARSLALLCDRYQSAAKAPPTKRLDTLKEWSAKYDWQARISAAVTARTEALLEQAAELDADTFLRTSRELNRRSEHADALQMDQVIRMRESVRKPTPKGGTAVSVKVSVEVRQLAEQMAEALGITADELIADAEEVARTAWEREAAR